jgi:hypothetical protein
MSWGRIIVIVILGVVGLVVLLEFAFFGLMFFSPMNETHIVEGSIEISPPGPPGVTAPAAVCMSGNGLRMRTPAAARQSKGSEAYVLCTLDTQASAPFEVSSYSASGVLIEAFLMSLPAGYPACEGQRGLITTVEGIPQLDSLCASDDMPPRAEAALMAPFDEDYGHPTSTMRIAITKAE